MCLTNPQEDGLNTMLELVCLHNVSILKFRNPEFTKHLAMKDDIPSYETPIATSIQLIYVVEEKNSNEMKGNKGQIIHDGWSRYVNHFVALMAFYLIEEQNGDKKEWKKVISLLACSTLPSCDEESE